MTALALLGATVVAAGQDGATVDDSYAAQVLFGELVYSEQCARCHGESGEGGEAPRLIGDRGLAGFRNAQRLFVFTNTSMPVDDPASLAEEEYFAVVAYLLEQNGYNPEQVPLDPATAEGIAID